MTTPTYNYAGSVPRSYTASGTIAIGEACKLDTSARVLRTTAITDDVEGIAITAAADGEQVVLQQRGVAKVLASGVVTTGDQVMPTASGAGRCSTAAGATAKSFGKAYSTSAADGEFIAVDLKLGVNGPLNA